MAAAHVQLFDGASWLSGMPTTLSLSGKTVAAGGRVVVAFQPYPAVTPTGISTSGTAPFGMWARVEGGPSANFELDLWSALVTAERWWRVMTVPLPESLG